MCGEAGADYCAVGTKKSRPARRALLPRDRVGALERELLDPIADLVAIEAQERGGLGLVPAGAFERLNHQRPLELLEVETGGRQLDLAAKPDATDGAARGEVLDREHRVLRQQHRALDGVPQLADVAGP